MWVTLPLVSNWNFIFADGDSFVVETVKNEGVFFSAEGLHQLNIDFIIHSENAKIKHKLIKKELVAVQQIAFENASDKSGKLCREFIVSSPDNVSIKYLTVFGGKKSKEIQYIDCQFEMSFACVKDLQCCKGKN